jgi:hypothetical protein
MYLTD